MRLRSLRLENYRRYRASEIEFPDGLIAVVGPNGAGKSTLLEAVGWALFGHDASRTEKELVRRASAAVGDDVLVRVEFEHEGMALQVTRRLRGKSQQSEAQVQVDGKLVASPGANSAEAATRWIAKLLGFDHKGFHATVFARQGDLKALSDLRAGERKRLILALLGVDEVDAAIGIARTRKREAGIRLDEARRSLARGVRLREEEAGARKRLAETESELAAAQASLCDLRAAWERARAELQRQEALRDQAREARVRLEGLQRGLQSRSDQARRLSAEIRLLEEKDQLLQRRRAREPEFEGLDAALAAWESAQAARTTISILSAERGRTLQELERQRRAVETFVDGPERIRALEAAASQLEADAERHARAISKGETREAALHETASRLQREATDVADQWRRLRDLGSDAPCPTCGRALGALHAEMEARAARAEFARKNRVEDLAREAKEVQAELQGLRAAAVLAAARMRETGQLLKQASIEQAAVAVARPEVGRLSRRLSELEEELVRVSAAAPGPPSADDLVRRRQARDDWRRDVARLETDVARLPTLRSEFVVGNAQVEEHRREIEALSRDLARMGYEEAARVEAQRGEGVARQRWQDSDKAVSVLLERRAAWARTVEEAEREIGRLEEEAKRARELEDLLRLSELLASDRGEEGVLPQFRAHMIASLRPQLGRLASELVTDMTGGRYREVVLDEEYGIQLYDGAHAWPIHRFSGGEADVVHLALRLAVGELLARARGGTQPEFVALDEVLASQDEGRRRSVLASLKGLNKHFRQIFLVTHLDEVRDLVDHVVQLRPNGNGETTLDCSWTVKV